ncbi:hypothetical protein GUJ93_ZPchr0006g45755 [Zizania palustris]|uniref:Uncharacterized protein n=1 Tax=Zizania palustris TaxID=103762 RepID=A0A8J5T8M7_ZIZPA|nr:hypothetical protein GUJ93_ZPchr0006g45755 [Zizania palustris]
MELGAKQQTRRQTTALDRPRPAGDQRVLRSGGDGDGGRRRDDLHQWPCTLAYAEFACTAWAGRAEDCVADD